MDAGHEGGVLARGPQGSSGTWVWGICEQGR